MELFVESLSLIYITVHLYAYLMLNRSVCHNQIQFTTYTTFVVVILLSSTFLKFSSSLSFSSVLGCLEINVIREELVQARIGSYEIKYPDELPFLVFFANLT